MGVREGASSLPEPPGLSGGRPYLLPHGGRITRLSALPGRGTRRLGEGGGLLATPTFVYRDVLEQRSIWIHSSFAACEVRNSHFAFMNSWHVMITSI